MSSNTLSCIACERTQAEVPLITLTYQNTTFCICPQHLPLLIHNPQMLVGKLAGAEDMKPAEHHD